MGFMLRGSRQSANVSQAFNPNLSTDATTQAHTRVARSRALEAVLIAWRDRRTDDDVTCVGACVSVSWPPRMLKRSISATTPRDVSFRRLEQP